MDQYSCNGKPGFLRTMVMCTRILYLRNTHLSPIFLFWLDRLLSPERPQLQTYYYCLPISRNHFKLLNYQLSNVKQLLISHITFTRSLPINLSWKHCTLSGGYRFNAVFVTIFVVELILLRSYNILNIIGHWNIEVKYRLFQLFWPTFVYLYIYIYMYMCVYIYI